MPNITWELLWRDRGVERGLNRTADATAKAERQAKAFKTAVGVGLVVAGAAAVKFGASSVRAYAEAQTAQNRLQDAFSKFPRLADTNISSLRALNTQLAQKTRFDDDATASGQAVLAQFKLTGQQITQLTPLLQDYAARTGKDLPTAAKDLGRAMLGQGRALKVVGINFKDTGTTGGNFAQIMSGLRTQVGGFAEKEGKTAAGQAEILKNQFGELQESVGQALLPALLKVGGGLLTAVNGFNQLDDSTKTTLITVGGGILTLGLSTVAIGKLAVGVRNARDAFRALGITAKGATIATASIGAVLGVAALAFGAYAEHSAKAKQAVDDYTEALKEDNNQLGANVRLMAAKKLQDEGAFAAAQKLGIGLDVVTDAALGNVNAQTAVNRATDAYIAAALNSADVDAIDRKNAAIALTDAVGGQNKAVRTAVSRAQEMAAAAGTAGASTADAGVKVKTAGQKAADASAKLRALAASMFKASEAGLALSGTEISYEQAVDDATAAAKRNGHTLDTNTQKGRDNRTALNNLITSSQGYISKLVETGKSSKRVQAASKDAKEEFIRVARSMGVGRDRAKELADRYFKIPKKVTTKHEAPGADHVKNQATALRKAINQIDGKTVKIRFTAQTFSIGGVKYHVNTTSPSSVGRSATGGKVRGPGTGTSDSVMGVDYAGMPTTRVSRGEWVINARSSAKHDALLRAINEDGLAAGGRLVKLRADFAPLPRALVRQPSAIQHIADDFAARVGPMLGRAVMKNVDSGMVGGKGFVNALRWARSQVGKPYIWTGVGPRGFDCSGFMSAIINVIKGRSPYHRLFSTGMAGGAHLAGMTKGKSSPFRIGVWKNNPGHTAGTLNGVNVESAGGVGVRVGRSARGANNGLFTMRYGLAKGGRAGDAPYDTTHQGGERYDPQLEKLWKMLLGPQGLHTGGVVSRPSLTKIAERGPERVLSAPQTRTFERMVSAMDRGRGVGGNTYHVTINAPNYVGSKQELRDTIVGMARKGQLDVIKR